jgi:GntR family transcriptional regulator
MYKISPADAVSLAPTPGVSRYAWLAADLRARILKGEWEPGQALAAETELARLYGVALGTMRQAIALLADEGLLERRHGKGTFVKAGIGGASMLRFFRFRHVDESSEPPASRILSRKQVPADAATAKALNLRAGAPVLALERLRSVGGQPCLLEFINLPLPLFAPLAKSDPADWGDLLYPEYQRASGVVVHRAEDQLSFDTLSASNARRLGLTKGHPCVRVRRRAYDLTGQCVEVRLTLGDAFDFEYTAQVS